VVERTQFTREIYFHVQKFKDQVRASSVVTLGHSMGGFYALTCTVDIGATAAAALAPQISMHPKIDSVDHRWMGLRARNETYRYADACTLITGGPQYFVLHDETQREKPQRDRTPQGKIYCISSCQMCTTMCLPV
jgi:alpha-beta hydrolase superfamily lysophospholipase